MRNQKPLISACVRIGDFGSHLVYCPPCLNRAKRAWYDTPTAQILVITRYRYVEGHCACGFDWGVDEAL